MSFQLPANTHSYTQQSAQGFATPQQDASPQTATFLPKRVIPIIFLPGIMGSNLRITDPERQRLLKQNDNKAWRPDDLNASNVGTASKADARNRQLRLDPLTTAVDIYEPGGPSDVSGDGRHSNVVLADKFTSPFLADDPPGTIKRKTAVQRARLRGWSEVYFKSYGQLLQLLESRLNNTFSAGKIREEWLDVVGVDPATWQADPSLPQQPLTEAELKKVATGCCFPVYAFGYNWLESNGKNAPAIARRINAVLKAFQEAKFECDKVIVVTHSMGGLLARALIHPDYGNLNDKVLGMVHGVMPAIGAGAAYKRMRAGFDDPGLGIGSIETSIAAKVAGNYGDEVTAVLANSPGGLELLPTSDYGNGWLRVTSRGKQLAAWPKEGDPYEEIYKIKDKWYSLIREEWINPSNFQEGRGGGSFDRTSQYLDQAKQFHHKIKDTYHDCSYAHYGADQDRITFGDIVWEISPCANTVGWESWPILSDTRQGRVNLVQWSEENPNTAFGARVGATVPDPIRATILPPTDRGDETVPVRSSDQQLLSKKFKGIFRQTGYDHQGSYQNANALASTLYSIVRIALREAS